MRFFAVELICGLVLIFTEVAAVAQPMKDKGNAKQAVELSSLQGVWEQTSMHFASGRLEETNPKRFTRMKSILVVHGFDLHFVGCTSSTAFVYSRKMHLRDTKEGKAFDLVTSKGDRTECCLYERNEDLFSFCYNEQTPPHPANDHCPKH